MNLVKRQWLAIKEARLWPKETILTKPDPYK